MFWVNFLNPKRIQLEKFSIIETRKTQTWTPKRQLNSNSKKSKLDPAIFLSKLSSFFSWRIAIMRVLVKFQIIYFQVGPGTGKAWNSSFCHLIGSCLTVYLIHLHIKNFHCKTVEETWNRESRPNAICKWSYQLYKKCLNISRLKSKLYFHNPYHTSRYLGEKQN